MSASERTPSPPPPAGGGDVRVTAASPGARMIAHGYRLGAAAVVIAAVAWMLHTPVPARSVSASAAVAAAEAPATPPRQVAPIAVRANASAAARRTLPAAIDFDDEDLHPVADEDPDDLAAYFRPGDPVPTAAELIEALQHAGIHRGLGAFNPPGTSPPLAGIAVPEDYELPEGYMRHYQSTDEGEPIEAILLFSPDYEFVDAFGRPIEVPDDRVVPPELAPPGLPIRMVTPPSP